jgi:excisionase family DNA binding protein
MGRIRNLKDHPSRYVTTSDLAEYWLVSRKQIYKQIEAGTLKAIRLGPRLFRISKEDALEFERASKMTPSDDTSEEREHGRTSRLDQHAAVNDRRPSPTRTRR